MKRRFFLWVLPLAAGSLGALTLLLGAAAGMSGRLGERVGAPPAPTPVPRPAEGQLRIVAIGDSLTRGTGDRPGGGGYPERVAAALRKGGRVVDVVNLGIDGFETKDLLDKLRRPGTLDEVGRAGLILMSISGNDLTHGTARASASASAPSVSPLIAARANLSEILGLLRQANPSAPIRLLGLYNPLSTAEGESPVTRQMLMLWNGALEETTLSLTGTVVVPLADLFAARPDRLAKDRFHPGESGYDEIAARLIATLPAELVRDARESARS